MIWSRSWSDLAHFASKKIVIGSGSVLWQKIVIWSGSWKKGSNRTLTAIVCSVLPALVLFRHNLELRLWRSIHLSAANSVLSLLLWYQSKFMDRVAEWRHINFEFKLDTIKKLISLKFHFFVYHGGWFSKNSLFLKKKDDIWFGWKFKLENNFEFCILSTKNM